MPVAIDLSGLTVQELADLSQSLSAEYKQATHRRKQTQYARFLIIREIVCNRVPEAYGIYEVVGGTEEAKQKNLKTILGALWLPEWQKAPAPVSRGIELCDRYDESVWAANDFDYHLMLTMSKTMDVADAALPANQTDIEARYKRDRTKEIKRHRAAVATERARHTTNLKRIEQELERLTSQLEPAPV